MQNNVNGTFGNVRRLPSSFKEFDNFPPRIREILRNAPYDVSTGAVKEYIEATSVDMAINWLIGGIPRVLKESTRLTYGPDHPQAQ